MNKVVIIGIILAGMVLGIWGILSLDSFSIIEGNDVSSEPDLGDDGEDSGHKPKSSGRDLSIELEEKMGLSAP